MSRYIKTMAAAVIIILTCSVVKAQQVDNNKTNISAEALKNLKAAILSDNEGVMKSGVAYAGLYKVEAVVDELAERFDKEKELSNKELIAHTLCKIGTQKAYSALKDLAQNVKNANLRYLCDSLADNVLERNGNSFTNNK